MDQRAGEHLGVEGVVVGVDGLAVFKPQPCVRRVVGAALHFECLDGGGADFGGQDRVGSGGLHGLQVRCGLPADGLFLIPGVVAEVPVAHGGIGIAVLAIGTCGAYGSERFEAEVAGTGVHEAQVVAAFVESEFDAVVTGGEVVGEHPGCGRGDGAIGGGERGATDVAESSPAAAAGIGQDEEESVVVEEVDVGIGGGDGGRAHGAVFIAGVDAIERVPAIDIGCGDPSLVVGRLAPEVIHGAAGGGLHDVLHSGGGDVGGGGDAWEGDHEDRDFLISLGSAGCGRGGDNGAAGGGDGFLELDALEGDHILTSHVEVRAGEVDGEILAGDVQSVDGA